MHHGHALLGCKQVSEEHVWFEDAPAHAGPAAWLNIKLCRRTEQVTFKVWAPNVVWASCKTETLQHVDRQRGGSLVIAARAPDRLSIKYLFNSVAATPVLGSTQVQLKQ